MMPAHKPATLRAEDLPEILTPQELADWERFDVRVVRADLKAGRIPGAYKRGAHYRIIRDQYLASVTGVPR